MMEKKVLILGGVVLAVLAIALIASQSSLTNLTSAAVSGQTKCLSPQAALKYINEWGCERIYEDKKCAEQGKVEVRCP